MLGSVPDFSCPILISGANRSCRTECAEDLCCLIEGKRVSLNSPDILFIGESPSPSAEQVRESMGLMQKFPIALPRRVGIVENLYTLSESAQDVLLKDLEEPAKKSSWILFSPALFRVPPAIKSRCHCYFISPSFGAKKPEEGRGANEVLSSLLSSSTMASAVRLAGETAGKAKEADDKRLFCFSFLSSLLSVFSKALMEKAEIRSEGSSSPLSFLPPSSLLFLTEEIKTSFDKVEGNVSLQLIFESLFCQIVLQCHF